MNSQINTLADSQSLSSQFDATRSALENDELLVIDRLQLRVDCPVEHFVQKLKDLSSLLHPFLQTRNSCQPLELSKESEYVYFRLEPDANESKLLVKLPSQNQVMDLVNVFGETNGNYHWYLRKTFQERIRQTYSDPTGETGDRNWFCRLLVVLAIAQAQKPEPKSSLAPMTVLSGLDLFGQAISLFSISEVPSADDIETLNLMVMGQFLAFYYYCNNRPNMAFMYIKQSIALAKLPHLEKATRSLDDNVEIFDRTHQCAVEHLRRLWWTAFCLEKKLITALGICSEQMNTSQDIPLPSSDNILTEDMAQFFDTEAFLENIQTKKV
ncbi:hypothetical protein HG530_005405 [Fusarium avenaceum]|nr:hypothetical protein HG530_005405 [Fusarium avenaceum]